MISKRFYTALSRRRFLNTTAYRLNEPNSDQISAPKTAIILLNMGGPQKREDVRPYMTELFLDEELLKLPAQPLLGRFIAWRRAPQIIERYETALGGYSPTEHWFDTQGRQVEAKLDKLSPRTAPHKCYNGFRYTESRTGTVLKNLDMEAVSNVVLFSQYPQHSCSTTGSSFCDAYRTLKGGVAGANSSKVSCIDQWYHHPGYIKLWQKMVLKQVEKVLTEHSDIRKIDIHVIYTAHSLPEAYVTEKGDKYAEEITDTVRDVHMDNNLKGISHTLAWQSKVGPKQRKWLGPSTPDVLEENTHKAVILVPIAFTCDHIETLDEIDIEFREEAEKNSNIKVFTRAECFNGLEEYSDILSDIVCRHISDNFTTNIRGPCHNCDGKDCKPMRKYFNDLNKSRKEESQDTKVAATA